VIALHTLAEAEAAGMRFAESRGAHSLAELRALSWQQLTAPAAPSVTTPPTGGRGGASFIATPIIDGYFLPLEEMEAVAQRKHNDVAVLAGCNLAELGPGGGMGGGGRQGPAATLETYQAQARQQYGDLVGEFLKLYPAASDQEVAAVRAQVLRDRGLSGMYLWAKQRNKTSRGKAFLYLWDHTLPGPNSERLGAFHTAEVPYVLNTLDMSDRPFTDADRKAAAMMSSYWANFTKNGDPNGPGLPVWAPVGDKPEIMEVGDNNGPVPAAGSAARSAFWERVLTR
jgi:para-nitrobenzyl esterase